MSSEPTTTVEFSWQAHPASERPGPAILGAVTVLGVAAAASLSGGSWAWGMLALVVLLGTLNRFYFRSRFRIDAGGITARFPLGTRRFEWRLVHRFVVDAHGGYLSTRTKRSWLDAYRGLHVLFGDQRETVIERIRTHLREGHEG